uniref:Ragulator complex protein LAMTOR1 n=1 Tax=Xenopus tropicalis TaxID=8364 RepID=A0A803JG43_XENTR
MGCCYSGETDTGKGDQGEREHLLPQSQSLPNKAPNESEQNSTNNPSARTDEQAMLSRILAKTAQNIIDVSAVESQGMEQHECMDRARQYRSLRSLLTPSVHFHRSAWMLKRIWLYSLGSRNRTLSPCLSDLTPSAPSLFSLIYRIFFYIEISFSISLLSCGADHLFYPLFLPPPYCP